MFPNQVHIGSVDVDILINHLNVNDSGYMSMERILVNNGYTKHPEKYFTFVKDVVLEGVNYSVEVDILAGKYGGTSSEKRSQHVQGMRPVKATGGNLAFQFPPQKIKVEGQRPDGALDSASINVVAVVPYLIMKTAALGRGKAKDAYDIYYVIKHYWGGVKSLQRNLELLRI